MSSYYRPDTLTEALGVLAGTGAVVAAGCTDLFPATGGPELRGPILDITAIGELRGIARTADGWRIGATTTWADLRIARLPAAFDMLKQAAAEVGARQIQNAGTVAGNLCNASPAADGVPPLLALDAEVELIGRAGMRRLPLAEFLVDARQTQRRPDELLTAVHVPARAGSGQSRFLKLGARKYLVISIAMVAVRLEVTNGLISDLAIAVGACSTVAHRLSGVEQGLIGAPVAALDDAVNRARMAVCLSPISDIRADAPYRIEAATELVNRALADLAGAS